MRRPVVRGAWTMLHTMETVFHVRRPTSVSYLFILCILRDMHKYHERTEKMSTANNASNEFTHHPNSAPIVRCVCVCASRSVDMHANQWIDFGD